MYKLTIENLVALAVVFFLPLSAVFLSVKYATIDSTQVHVKRIETPIENRTDKFLVFTDKGVYQNRDDLFMFKFNSADIRGEIEPGKDYIIEHSGVRFGLMSWFPNTLSIEPLNSKQRDYYDENLSFNSWRTDMGSDHWSNADGSWVSLTGAKMPATSLLATN